MALRQWPADKVEETMRYLRFLSQRSTGELPTGATFIRDFVRRHPAYRMDSKLSDDINYDVLNMFSTLNDAGAPARAGLLGEFA